MLKDAAYSYCGRFETHRIRSSSIPASNHSMNESKRKCRLLLSECLVIRQQDASSDITEVIAWSLFVAMLMSVVKGRWRFPLAVGSELEALQRQSSKGNDWKRVSQLYHAG